MRMKAAFLAGALAFATTNTVAGEPISFIMNWGAPGEYGGSIKRW